jgi:hypothetical protein
VSWKIDFVNWLRRTLLELWAILLMAGVVGFLGPFGTYMIGDIVSRSGRWWLLLMGAYLLVRPTIELLRWIAVRTGLPPGPLLLSGVVVASFPMALIWHAVGQAEFSLLDGYSELLPFAFLCALAIAGVVWWAERTDARLLGRLADAPSFPLARQPDRSPEPLRMPSPPGKVEGGAQAGESEGAKPRIIARLETGQAGRILALESEDHYVRVHMETRSELLLMRLRDAISEMDGAEGAQTHRSWWVARDGIAELNRSGRSYELRLTNGLIVPVARDSVESLRRMGFIPLAAVD